MKKLTTDELESLLARERTAASSNRRAFLKTHDKLRLLENAVRDFANGAVYDELELKFLVKPEALESLRRRVPVKARERRRGARA